MDDPLIDIFYSCKQNICIDLGCKSWASGLGFRPVETLRNPTRGSRNGSVETALCGDRGGSEEREITR